VGTSNARLGVVTAGQVVGARIGSRVAFARGLERVIDVAPAGIDAVLVKPPEIFDRTASKLKSAVAVAPRIGVQYGSQICGAKANSELKPWQGRTLHEYQIDVFDLPRIKSHWGLTDL